MTTTDHDFLSIVDAECARLDAEFAAAVAEARRRIVSHHAFQSGAKQREPIRVFAAQRRANESAKAWGHR